ncbi:hypothetical protein MNBD_GAMMA01-2191 [hydrothermal vent metagenome]|uniref:Uncharacterized protein n=1 Tax=hydrothermal vent metagenome TaxID=652676 RepID=A0A3B0V9S9_9ZZZZ
MTNKNSTQEIPHKGLIRQLLISTVLFLPLCFFIWFYASSLLVIPVKYLLQLILSLWQADLFNAVTQNQYLLNIETLIFPSTTFAGQGDKLAVLDVTVNPMLYGYGLAVIAGLVVSTPGLKPSKKALQIILGYILIVLIQTFGSFWEMVKHLLFTAGADAQQAILDTGLAPDFIALMYQLSYLIIPAVVPVAYWIIMNNDFIGEITGLKVTTDRNFDKEDLSDNQR